MSIINNDNISYDFVIIGGGIVGLSIARKLSQYKFNIALIEKDVNLCSGASSSNSATLHTGHSVLNGTLKAEMNISGNVMWDSISKELNIPLIRTGDYVVAINNNDLSILEDILEQGNNNGVKGLKIISCKDMKNKEPNINPDVKGALWSPNTGLIDPCVAALSIAYNILKNNVTVFLNTKFESFIITNKHINGIQTNNGIIKTRWVINAAGVYADDIMHIINDKPDFCITPRKGEYIVLTNSNQFKMNLLSPVPNRITKGIAIKPTIDGKILVGSNAQKTLDKNDLSNTQEGINEVWNGALKLFPKLSKTNIIAIFTGLRASGNSPCKNNNVIYNSDFIIEKSENVYGLIHIAGIESPGLTAAPAIADRVLNIIKNEGEIIRKNNLWNASDIIKDRNNLKYEAKRILENKYFYNFKIFF